MWITTHIIINFFYFPYPFIFFCYYNWISLQLPNAFTCILPLSFASNERNKGKALVDALAMWHPVWISLPPQPLDNRGGSTLQAPACGNKNSITKTISYKFKISLTRHCKILNYNCLFLLIYVIWVLEQCLHNPIQDTMISQL